MCGIHGGRVTPTLSAEARTRSLDAITHRGPDDWGAHVDGPVFLGMRRLSILDLEGGHQPIFNESGDVSVVFNGEVYNYQELIPELEAAGHVFRTRSDTEALVHLWEAHREGMCAHLRGMFAFAIWDASAQVLFVARDRFGKKPLYWSKTPNGGVVFASEIKALRPLIEAAGGALRVRQQGVYDYLSLGVIPQPETIYEGVHVLEPGGWMRLDARTGELRRELYWTLDLSKKTRLSYEDAQEEVRRLLGESVRLRLRSDVPLGVFLSSGVDSSVVAYEAAQALGGELETFTVGVDDPRLDEAPVAARTARALGVKNTVLRLDVSPADDLEALVRHYDQPFADSSAIPSAAISRAAREHVKVVLNGDGGDELFAGYRRHVAARYFGMLGWLPAQVPAALAQGLDALNPPRRSPLGFLQRLARGLAASPAARYLAWTCDMLTEADKRALWQGAPQRPTEQWLASAVLRPHASSLDAQLDADHRVNLLSDLLVKMDMATMFASLEGRSPLMDHVLGEFTATLPDHYRVRGRRPKAILRDAYRGRLPDEVIDGAKRGFEIPMTRWLQEDLRPMLHDTVGAADARVAELLPRAFIDDLLAGRAMQDRNHTYIVYALLVLELWLRDEG